MRIVENIKTFLYDRNYFINFYEDKLHVFNYIDLETLTDKEIILKFDNFIFFISGSNLHVIKMAQVEMLITGQIDSVRFKRWKILLMKVKSILY